jgi:small-conductance mechanosensitive channel
LLLVGLGAILGGTSHAQEAAPTPPAPSPTPAPTPIPAAEIPLRADQAVIQLRGFTEAAEPRGTVATISASLDELQPKLDRLSQATKLQLEHGPSASELWDLEKRWLREDALLDSWLATLQARATALEADLGRIRAIESLWQLTRDSAGDQDLPAALRKTVSTTIEAAADARAAVARRRDTVLIMQTEVTAVKADISEALAPVRDAIAAKRRNALLPEQPPIWRAFVERPESTKTLIERMRDRLSDQSVAVRTYLGDDVRPLVFHIVVFLLLLGLFLGLRRWAARWAAEDDSLRVAAQLLSRPMAAAVLLSTLIEAWIHPKAPEAWHNLLEVVLLIALLRLLPQILPRRLGPALYVLVVLFILWHTVRLVPAEMPHYRIVLLGMSVVSLGAVLWLARELGAVRDPNYPVWYRNIVRACRVGALMMAVAILANLIGNIALADLLTEGLMMSVFAALLLWVGAVVVRGAEAIALRTDLAQRLNIVRHSSDSIRAVTGKLIRFAAIMVWAISTIAAFALLRPLIDALRRLFKHEITVGSLTFSPLTVVSVLFVIWLIFKISRLARFVLETDVLPRVPLPRGVPGTISKITHYIILTIGFFVVVGMLGLDLTKFALIAGALSVGIGFGLQNVVNNFVSGLILLFERPIKEGDRIELGTTSGVVLKIGMRASVVRTWQGAEVIVPNATLISSELINWTLSDETRRVEIPIGVAYGSDPDRVLGILLELAREHPEVLRDPEPVSLFVRFGDSSLDFELRVWTTTDFLRVASELRSAITRSLKEAGIEIPFPQRDLHIKSGRLAAGEPSDEPPGPDTK